MSKNINKFILISIIMSVFIGVTGYSLGMSLGKNSIVKQPLPIDNNMAENDETENKDKVEDKNTSGESSSSDTGKTSKNDNKNSKNKNSSSGSSSGRSSRGGSSSSASSANTSIPSKLKDGVYYGSAKGYGGDIKVKVTVSNGKISDIKVENHSETPEYYDRCSGIIPNIISSQSTNVDGVSGATFTSNGIKSAVANALKNAGASTGSASGGGSGAGNEQSAEKPNQSADKEEIKKLKKQIEELQNSNDVSGKLKDGKYEGTGTGFKSTIKVQVVVKGGKIESIKVVENGDDHDYFEKAKALIQSIISTQSTKVDSISGATRSSDGIKSAVRDALKKATTSNGNSEELGQELSKLQEENKKLNELIKTLKEKIEKLEKDPQNPGHKAYNDGNYTGVNTYILDADKIERKISVDVQILEGKIKNVSVISIEPVTEADKRFIDDAKKGVIPKIIEKNTTSVDAVSGATYTSNGIKDAVNDALKKAVNPSANPTSDDLKNQLKQAIEEKERVEKEKEALEAQNTNLREENTSLKSAVEELKKKINETPSSLPSATKAIHENIMSTLSGAMGVEKVKTN